MVIIHREPSGHYTAHSLDLNSVSRAGDHIPRMPNRLWQDVRGNPYPHTVCAVYLVILAIQFPLIDCY